MLLRGGASDTKILQRCSPVRTQQVWPGTVKRILGTRMRTPTLFDNRFSSVSPEAQPVERSAHSLTYVET